MTLFRLVYDWFAFPARFVPLHAKLSMRDALVLDVGCGNHSPSLTKKYFPKCIYHGVDSIEWNLNTLDRKVMDRFFQIDVECKDQLSAIENEKYDVVICSHVLEHLQHPGDAILSLSKKVNAGGLMYIEVPSKRSLLFPQAREGWCGVKGCLNFYDDPTHQNIVDLLALLKVISDNGFVCSAVKKRAMCRRIVFLPFYAITGMILKGYIPASVLWDVLGFSDYVVIERMDQ